MKTKRKVIRNFIYKGKRKRVEDGPIESPIASEQGASFTFHTNEKFSVWLLCLTLRYGEHLSKSFDVDWCDVEDQSGTPLESLIKVSHLPDRFLIFLKSQLMVSNRIQVIIKMKFQAIYTQ